MRRWKRFWQLSRQDRLLLLEGLGILTCSRLGLRLLGYGTWSKMLARLSGLWEIPSLGLQSDSEIPTPEAIVKMVQAASRNAFFQPSCLERSLVLHSMLNWRGY